METLPAKTNGNGATAPGIEFSREHVELIKQTVAKGATDAELKLFLECCKSTGLNPFKKEIWFIKTANGVQLMTGINGFYALANSNPQFDGLESEVVADENGALLKAVARVYRKDRAHPTTAEAYFAEYAKPHGVWKQMPRVMLLKCAESMALRKAFPQQLNGLYSEEEMPSEFGRQMQPPKVGEKLQSAPPAVHAYCLDNIEPDKAQAVLDYLEEHKGAIVEQFGNVYVTKHDLKRLANYKLKPGELAEARRAADVLDEPAPDAHLEAQFEERTE
jgi:phage recombination protein Bet